MQHGKVALAMVVVTVALASALAWGAPASASGTVYSFRLVQPNTALATVFDEHHHPGDWIRVTGSGTFDPAANRVQAEGSFTHYNADGSVHLRGTWVATGITSFTAYQGPKPVQLGGVLWLTVAHFLQDGTPCDCMGTGGVPMSVTSAAWAPPGTVTGTTMGPFQQPTGGSVGFSVVDS
jgi:hypothetical protein